MLILWNNTVKCILISNNFPLHVCTRTKRSKIVFYVCVAMIIRSCIAYALRHLGQFDFVLTNSFSTEYANLHSHYVNVCVRIETNELSRYSSRLFSALPLPLVILCNCKQNTVIILLIYFMIPTDWVYSPFQTCLDIRSNSSLWIIALCLLYLISSSSPVRFSPP